MSRVDVAQNYFSQGFSCSQAVAAAFAGDFGLEPATLLRVAAAFGGGVARSGDTCGAVTGGLMVIGLCYGIIQPDPPAKERTYERAREFLARFRARHGAVACRALLGHDFSTAEGQAAIKERRLTHTICPGLVTSAVAILEQMLGA